MEAESKMTPGEQLAHSLGGSGKGHRLHLAAATDGSTFAQRAVARSCELARTLEATLTLLVVASDRDDVAHSQKIMEEACQLASNIEPKPQTLPLVGYADEVLLQQLSQNPVDLLVIGAFQDRGAGATTAIGPTAQRLVQHAPTSVLMLKGHRPQIRKILASVAVDDKIVVDVAGQLAKAIGAELTLLHVVPPMAASYLSPVGSSGVEPSAAIPLEEVLAQGTHLSSVLRGWITQLEDQGLNQDVMLVRRGSAPEAILKMAHDGDYDLIVVGSQSGPGHFLGSVANSVVRYAEQSVLVVRMRPV
jgi:nucleotide-binding universal stress UspA family protein